MLAPHCAGVILFPITVGSPGRPAAFEVFAGMPTQVKMSASGPPPGRSQAVNSAGQWARCLRLTASA